MSHVMGIAISAKTVPAGQDEPLLPRGTGASPSAALLKIAGASRRWPLSRTGVQRGLPTCTYCARVTFGSEKTHSGGASAPRSKRRDTVGQARPCNKGMQGTLTSYALIEVAVEPVVSRDVKRWLKGAPDPCRSAPSQVARLSRHRRRHEQQGQWHR